jgi:hypothetical protein
MAKPELYNSESVINYYNASPFTMYRVYYGYKPDKTTCRYEYLNDDKGEGEKILVEALQAIESNKQNTNVYTLELIKEIEKKQGRDKEIVKEIPAVCIAFQINNPLQVLGSFQRDNIPGQPVNIINPMQPATGDAYADRFIKMMQDQNDLLKQELKELREKIEQLNEADDDDDDDDVEEVKQLPLPETSEQKIIGALAGILQREEVQNAASAIIMGLATKFMKKD